MKKIWYVAWREFRHTVLTKAFFFGAIIAPLVFGALAIAASIFLKPEPKPLVGRIAVVSPHDELLEPMAEALVPDNDNGSALPDITGLSAGEAVEVIIDEASAGTVVPKTIDVEVVAVPESEIDAVKAGIRDGTWTALVIVKPSAIDVDGEARDNRVSLFVSPDSPPSHTETLERAARGALTHARVATEGLDPELVSRLTARPRVKTVRLTEGGDEKTEIGDLRRFLPIAFMFLVWITTFVSGNYLLTSTIEEKSNRVIEVLLSAVSPLELMAGKILGYAMVTVVMVAMFSVLIVGFLIMASALDLITPIQIVLMVVFLIMSYLMVAAIMAGIGSAVSDMRDAQTLLGPVSLAVMIPLFLSPVVTEAPNGLVAIITTYIPPLTPFVMILRILATEPVSNIEIIISLVWGFACAVGLVWLASRIFRVGVLMQGKPPSPMEMIRWARYH